MTFESRTPYGSLAIRRTADGEWSAEVGFDADTQARLDEAEAEETGAGLRTFWEEVVRPVTCQLVEAGYEVAVTDADSTIYLRIRDGGRTIYIVVDSEHAVVDDTDPAPFSDYRPA